MNYSKKISLKFKLTVSTVILIIIPMIFATIYSISVFNEKSKKDFKNILKSVNYSINIIIDNENKKIMDLSTSLSKETGLIVALKYNLDAQVGRYIEEAKKNNGIDKIYIYSEVSGKIIGRDSDGLKEDKIVNSYLKKRKNYSGYFYDQELYIVSISQIIDNSNSVVGLMVIKQNFTKNNQLISEIINKLETSIIIATVGNVLEIDGVNGKINRNLIKTKELYSDKTERNSIYYTEKPFRLDKKQSYIYLTSIKDIFGNNIGMIGAAKDSNEIFKSIIDITLNMLMICLLFISAAIVVTVYILKLLLEPLKRLIDALNAVGRGDLTKRFEVKNRDEIGIVGENFNKTVDKIETMIKEIDEANEKLKVMDKIKDEFLANTSHELRTPLNGIIGLSESLVEGVSGNLPEKALYNLGMIISSGRRLLGLVNDILDFSKLKNRDIEISEKSVDIYEIVEIVFMMNKPLADSKLLYLKNEIPQNFPLLLGDENRLEQILYNLIGNAIKFTEKGGVTICAEIKNENAVISVKDTGMGIPEDKFERIFESFEQLDGSISRKYGGTGLGLSITKKLVEIHGGSIRVESKLKIGSSFIFEIPFSKESNVYRIEGEELKKDLYRKKSIRILNDAIGNIESIEVSKENDLRAYEDEKVIMEFINKELMSIEKVEFKRDGQYKVLVVDDEIVNLQVLVNYLELNKIDVSIAQNGMDALGIMTKEVFDLVILDVMMPRMSGFEVCGYIRKKYSIFEMPVLILTAKKSFKDLELGFNAGANDYLTKPFEKTELFSRLTTLLNLKDAVLVSIENAKKYSSEKQSRELAEKLNSINNTLTAELKIERVIEKLFRIFSDIVNCENIRMNIKIENHYEMFEYRVDIKEMIREDLLEESQAFKDIFTGLEPVITENSEKSQVLGIPIIYREERIGGIIFDIREKIFFEDYDLKLLKTIARQAVVALENAILFEEVEKWTKKLESSNNALEYSLNELKMTQEQLILSEKMAVLGGLVAGISHEINTPVGIGVTAASFLEEETITLEKKMNENQLRKVDLDEYITSSKESSRLILKNLKRASELIRSFKQVSVDQTTGERRVFKLKSYIEDIIASMRPGLKNGKHEIEVICSNDIEIDNYPGAFSQVFTNFIMNSVTHGFEGISGGKMTITVEKNGDELAIFYKDNGRGIPKDNLSKIFDPFFTTKRNAGGTGLGLHIVYNLVTQKMLGKIECRSEEGKGVEFLIKMKI